jgi:hypothetical protein
MPSGDISCVIRLTPPISLPKSRSSSGLLAMGSGSQGRETSPYASTCALRLQRFVGICSLCRVQVCTWWPWVFWRIVGDGCKYIRQDQNHTQGIRRPASLVYTFKSSSYLVRCMNGIGNARQRGGPLRNSGLLGLQTLGISPVTSF